MPNIIGKVNAIFDNRMGKNGVPNKFPNWKIMIGSDDYTLWSAMQPVCKKGDQISLTYEVGKTGSKYVITKEDKTPMIQVMPNQMDDPLPKGEMESVKFEPVEYEKENTIDKKGMTIWIQGLLQSGVRAGNFKVDEINESTLAHLIDLYNKVTK